MTYSKWHIFKFTTWSLLIYELICGTTTTIKIITISLASIVLSCYFVTLPFLADFFKIINWFYFWLCWVFIAVHGLSLDTMNRATLHCNVWASHCGNFYCCGAQALGPQASIVAACGFWGAGSVVVAHGLSCSAACGIFLGQGSNPCSPALAGGFLSNVPPRKDSHPPCLLTHF